MGEASAPAFGCDVAVVGAGYAGLIAARDLVSKGVRAVVLEAGDRVGGRCWSKPFPGTDAIVDWGAEWVLPAHHHALLAEAAAYGVALEPAADAPPLRWQAGGAAVHAGFQDLLAQRPGVARIMRRLEEAARHTAGGPGGGSLAAAIRQAGDDPQDCAFAEAAIFPLSGADPADLSVTMVLNEIRFHGGSIAETIAPAEITRMNSGTDAVARRIAASLGPDVLRLNHSVTSVDDDGTGVSVSGPFGVVRARRAVIALPVNVIARLAITPPLPPEVARVLAEGHAGRTAKLWALVRHEGVLEECLIAGHAFRLTYARALGGGLHLVCAQALADDVAQLSPADHARLFRDIRPEAEVLDTAIQDWTADPHALGSWHAARPGQDDALAALRRPHGRLVFCGGDISADWSGWIEGAIRSGAGAARMVLNDG